MNQRDLIIGLDACRANSDDLAQPEMREVSQFVAADASAARLSGALKRFDAATRRSMQAAPLPDQFQVRLIARLREAAALSVAVAATDDTTTTTLPISPAQRPLSRRKWLAWSAGGMAAVAAAVTVVMLLRPAAPLEPQDLEAARNWHEALAMSDGWTDFLLKDRQQHALPRELQIMPRRYRDASQVVGREALAYDVSLPGGPAATLFVIPQADQAGMPRFVPPVPQSSTLGQSVAFWQSRNVIYVVVLEGNRRSDYRHLLNATPSAAA